MTFYLQFPFSGRETIPDRSDPESLISHHFIQHPCPYIVHISHIQLPICTQVEHPCIGTDISPFPHHKISTPCLLSSRFVTPLRSLFALFVICFRSSCSNPSVVASLSVCLYPSMPLGYICAISSLIQKGGPCA